MLGDIKESLQSKLETQQQIKHDVHGVAFNQVMGSIRAQSTFT